MERPHPFEDCYRTTEALTVALHVRDEHTRHHCDRVVDLAIQLAMAIRLDRSNFRFIEICARFHDIGKVGVPDSILLKPGRLSDEEWRIMKTHSEMGEQIVGATALPDSRNAARVIRHHHENFSGDGYPDALKGEAIPVESRIIFIVDAYDAMRTTRPNRSPMDHEKVISIMASEDGWKFDPAIFKHFHAVAARIH